MVMKKKKVVWKSSSNICAGLRSEKEKRGMEGEETKLGEAAPYTNGVSAQTNELLPFQQRPRACGCPIQSFFLVPLQATFTSDLQSSQTFVCLRHTHMAPTVVKMCFRIAQSPCHTVSPSPRLSMLDGTDNAVAESSIVICDELDAMSFPSSRLSPFFSIVISTPQVLYLRRLAMLCLPAISMVSWT